LQQQITKKRQQKLSKNVKDVKVVEIASKSKYERLARSHERLMQRVEDLEDLVKEMRFRDRNVKQFISNYLKPRYKPRLSKDGENELWSVDGRHYCEKRR
jgi:Holliday junction resolvasome RuvABC ATP-dependent DNA helicase subunit